MLLLLLKHRLIAFLQTVKYLKDRGYFKWAAYSIIFVFLLENGLHVTLEIGKEAIAEETAIHPSTIHTSPKGEEPAKALLAANHTLEFVEPTTSGTTSNSYTAYIQQYSKIAQQEMKAYGVPASIKLGQALIESQAGNSRLARKSNNHFGIKCFSKKCQKGHCTNFSDDSHKDFFRKFDSVWGSYRAHSEFLQKDRYKPLFKLGEKNYKAWARGLSKAGYATDPKYADKLIGIIERYELHQYDR